jgi:ribosomal protein S18 acetylase RimI-like enzyme
MWVVPERRNHGVGRALVEAAVSWSRAVGARALVLDVTTDNTSAQRLYERSGFVAIGDPKPLRPGSTLQARSMHLVLRADTSASSA